MGKRKKDFEFAKIWEFDKTIIMLIPVIMLGMEDKRLGVMFTWFGCFVGFSFKYKQLK